MGIVLGFSAGWLKGGGQRLGSEILWWGEMNPNERAGGSRDSRMRRRNIFHWSQLCNDFINQFPKELGPLALRRALGAAAGAGKLFPRVSAEAAKQGGGASSSRPGRVTPTPWHLSSKQ